MDEKTNREPDSEFRVLRQEANHLERVVRETNNLPENFPEEAFLDLCRASRLTAATPPEQRPLLLRYLSDTLAALHPAIPRVRDAETGDHEFPHLNGAFNALQAEVLHLANTVREVPPPPTPDEPRNDPDSPEVARIVETGRETVQAVQQARETLDASTGMSLTQTNIENRSLVTVVVNGNLNRAEAGALIGSVAAPLKEVTTRTLDGLGTLLTDWSGHTRRGLNAAGFGLEVGTDVMTVFGMTGVAEKTGALGKVLRHHAARLSGTSESIAGPRRIGATEEDIDDLLDLMGAALRRDDTEKAADLAERILAHSKANEKLPSHRFDINGSGLSNLSPLAGLSSLLSLSLTDTGVTDVSALSGLTGLQTLDLSFIRVTDVSALSGLTGLQSLDLRGTDVTDVSTLSGLTGLHTLDLSFNSVTDVSALSSLTGLQSLDLSRTSVRDVSALSGLTGLQFLDLRGTEVSDISALSGFDELQTLSLGGANVRDVSVLSGLIGLRSLDLSRTNIRDARALSGLTGLQFLDLRGTNVRDVSVLSGLTGLQSLHLGSTNVTDVSSLLGLTGLQSLDLSGTNVTDVSSLSGLTGLRSLDLSGTNITDVSALSGLTGLGTLDLRGTNISDVSALSGLPRLQTLLLPQRR